MSEQIKKSDLIQGDPFLEIKETIDKSLQSLLKYDEELKQVSKSFAEASKSIKSTTADLAKLVDIEKKQSDNTKEAQRNEKEKIKLQKEAERARIAELKLQKEREKAFDKYEKQLQREQKEKEKIRLSELKLQKEREKAFEKYEQQLQKQQKLEADKNNAYKQLSANTQKLKDESKRLGAELLKLEASGKKNSTAYKQLSAQYRETTKAAQLGDAQLKKLDKTVGDNQKNVGNYVSALGGLKSVLGAVGVAFGTRQLLSFGSESIELFRIQQKAIAQVEAGLKSTGNTAGFTSQELQKMASALQGKTIFGDEQILQDATAQLLTFTNISGEQFARTQEAALDLATRLDGDLKSASIQLGKALNDPVANLSALSRSGIQFSNEQKEVIKTLAESGRLAEAQTLILDELNKQYGGSAEAAAEADGGIQQLKNAIGDAKEVFGQYLLEALKPTIQGLKDFFSNLKPEDIQRFLSLFGSVLSMAGKAVVAWGAYKGILIAVQAQQALTGKGLKGLFTGLTDVFKGTKQAGEGIKGMNNALKSVVWVAIIGAIIEMAKAFWDVASGAKAAREQAELTERFISRGADRANKNVQQRSESLQKELQLLEQKRNEDIALAKTEKQRNAIQAQFLKDKQKLIDSTGKEIKGQIQQKNARKEQIKQDLERLKVLEQEYKSAQRGNIQNQKFLELREEAAKIAEKYKIKGEKATLFGIETGERDTAGAEVVIRSLTSRIREVNTELTTYNKELDDVGLNLSAATSEVKVNTIEQSKNTGAISANVSKIKEQNKYISEQQELLKEINEINNDFLIRTKERQLADLLLGDEASIQEAKAIVDQITKLKEDAINAQADYELQKLKEIQSEYANDPAFQADLALKKQLIEQKRIDDLIEINQSANDQLNQINNDLLSKNATQAVENVEEVAKGSEEVVKDYTKEIVEIINDGQQTLMDAYERATNRKIELAKREEELANEQIDRLQSLAEQGAILDEQSLADAERRKREAIEEQLRLQKRQERAQFISAALSNISNQLANGKSTGEAVSSTVSLQAAIKALFSGFDGFYKGTDNAPEGFAWVDEKGAEIHTDKHGNVKDFGQSGGARLKYLEKGDKIIPHHKSIELLNSGLPTVQDMGGFKVDPALDLLREQNRLLKNAVESKITAEELGRVIHLTTEDKRGNYTRLNRYKYYR